jgi:hypothetical protein
MGVLQSDEGECASLLKERQLHVKIHASSPNGYTGQEENDK